MHRDRGGGHRHSNVSAPAAQRIGLGTAQLGLDYGVTNESGRVSESEAASILALAVRAGMNTVDTARLYGESEAVLGRCMPIEGSLRIVTKSPKFGDLASPADAGAALVKAFDDSLAKLRRETVHGLLLHDPTDLLGPAGDALWTAMTTLKDQRRVNRVGVSVYEGAEIDVLLGRYPLDIVQLPYNPIDQRLVAGGQLTRLRAAGVEVHARSLFLQGLLLQSPDSIPARFEPVRRAARQLAHSAAEVGISQLEYVLALAFKQAEIDRFICGVTAATELEAIVLAAETAQRVQERVAVPITESLDPLYLNPARWSKLGQGERKIPNRGTA